MMLLGTVTLPFEVGAPSLPMLCVMKGPGPGQAQSSTHMKATHGSSCPDFLENVDL